MRKPDHAPLLGANLLRIFYVVGSAIVVQLYLKDLGASPLIISLSEMVFWAALLIFAPFWGALSDSSGRRKIFLTTSILLAGVSILGYIFLEGVLAVLLLRILFSILASGFPAVADAVVSEQGGQKDRSTYFASFNTSRSIGFLIGWGGSGILLDYLGFKTTYLLFAAVGIVGFFVARRITCTDDPHTTTLAEVWDNAKHRWLPSRTDASLREKGMNYLLAGMFLRKAAVVGIMSLIAVYITDIVHLSASLTGIILSINAGAQILFISPFGKFADIYGRRKVLIAGFALSLPMPILLYLAEGPILLFATFFFMGFSFAAIVQGSTAFIGDVAPDGRQGEFMGLRKSAQGLAGVAGPITAGVLAELIGMRSMMLSMAVLMVLGTFMVWYGTEETMPTDALRTSFIADTVGTVQSFRK